MVAGRCISLATTTAPALEDGTLARPLFSVHSGGLTSMITKMIPLPESRWVRESTTVQSVRNESIPGNMIFNLLASAGIVQTRANSRTPLLTAETPSTQSFSLPFVSAFMASLRLIGCPIWLWLGRAVPYRRIAFRQTRAGTPDKQLPATLPITNRRYGRLQSRATQTQTQPPGDRRC